MVTDESLKFDLRNIVGKLFKNMMAKNTIPIFWILLLCCWAAMGEAGNMKYKDPKYPVSARVKDLMKRMTLEEKIGQMVQIERTVASADVMKKYFIGTYPSIDFSI